MFWIDTKEITVNKLIEQLKALEAEGLGEYKISLNENSDPVVALEAYNIFKTIRLYSSKELYKAIKNG